MGLTPFEMAIRRVLAGLAKSPNKRFVGQPPERPNNWKPGEVADAEGFGLTDPAAWELIAERLLDEEQTLGDKVLDKPPGAIAYVMKFPLPHLVGRTIYVKFECLKPKALS